MANKVVLKIRVKLTDGKWHFLKPVFTPSGRLKPLFALVHGNVENHPEGNYYLRFRRVGNSRQGWSLVGKNPEEAVRQQKQMAAMLSLRRSGIAFAEPVKENSRSLLSAITEYSAEIATQKSRRTASVYGLALARFKKCCKKRRLADISRQDLMEFITFLRDEGLSDRSVHNGLERILTFLRWCGITGLLTRNDKPKYTAKKVDAYDDKELADLYSASSQEEKLLWQFFVHTGMREGEVAHVYYSDVNFNSKVKTVSVREKPEWGWKPKDKEERETPIPDWLAERIALRRQSHPNEKLIFPNAYGRPGGHLLKRLKKAAKKAGLECTVELHKFRKTAATTWMRNGVDVRTIQRWLGHGDLETTEAYLKPSKTQDERVWQMLNSEVSDSHV